MSFQKYVSGKPVVQMYLLDNSFRQLLIEPSSTTHDLCLMMAKKLGFADPEDDCLLFGVSEAKDGFTIGRAVKRDVLVMDILRDWESEDLASARLVFKINLYTEGLMDTADPRVREMLFIQTVYNVVSGLYPCDKDDALRLAALQFVARFGEFKPEVHAVGFLGQRLREFIPVAHLNAGSDSLKEWERNLYVKVATLDTSTPMKDYIEYLRYRDYYGAMLFAVKQKWERDPTVMPKRIFLGISRQGVLFLKIPENYTSRSMSTFKRFPLGDIFRWAFKPGEHFYFEVKAEDGGEKPDEYKVKTPEGEPMSDLLTDYAMALLREMGLNPDGTAREKKVDAAGGGAGSGAAAASATSADASGSSHAMPSAARMAKTDAAYASIAGEVGALASAATRSGAVAADDADEEEDGLEEEEEDGAGAGEEEEQLPPGWTKQYDEESERHYYFNTETEESSWDVPAE